MLIRDIWFLSATSKSTSNLKGKHTRKNLKPEMDMLTMGKLRNVLSGWVLPFLWGNSRREISLFIGGDSVPFRPRHGRVHQSPRIDEDSTEQWPCCGPIQTLRIWHFCLTLASGNANNNGDSHICPPIKLCYKTTFLQLEWVSPWLNIKLCLNNTYASLPLGQYDCI